jgi:hypothetical protein
MPKCEDQDQRASMQSEVTVTNHSSSYAHDDILTKCDEKREIKGRNEDLGFKHDKWSTHEDQSANASSEGCSTSGAHTDALVITPKDQQDKKSQSVTLWGNRSNRFSKPA